MSECVCFILAANKQVLFEHRYANDKLGSARVNIPGGHIEAGELQETALQREVLEELGVKPLSYRFICSQPFAAIPSQTLHYYLVDQWAGEVKALEAQKVEWLKPSKKLGLSDADLEALKQANLLVDGA